MATPPERPSFRQIYREQYRKDSASRTTRAFQFITPAVLLAGALLARHSPVVPIVLVALAVVLFAAAVVLSRRQRRTNRLPSGGDEGPPEAGPTRS